MSPPIRNVVILSAWSSGSTAVAGYLARLGVHTAPPHQATGDPLTPDSHESRALRRALTQRIDELGLQPRTACDLPPFGDWLREWITAEHEHAAEMGATHMLLKHPLLAFFIDDLRAVCDPRFVIVTRDLEAIERTRQRRGWHPVYGRSGATVLYQRIFSACLDGSLEALVCPFDRFRHREAMRTDLCRWLGMDDAQRETADAWIR